MVFSIFKKKKTNVIMIMMDGVRPDVLFEFKEYTKIKNSSLFFSQSITFAPYTLGSLHAVISGMNGTVNGVDGYYKALSFDDKHCKTLTTYLQEQGYTTHCDLIHDKALPHQGFDSIRAHDEFKDDLVKRHKELLTRLASEDFFLFLDYSNVHTAVVENVIRKYDDFSEEYFSNQENNRKNYLQWVGKSDDYLKHILDHIRTLGLDKNSLVVIFNDHGCSLGEKKGEKVYGSFLYDYTIKCWLSFMHPRLPKEIRSQQVRHIDIMPTILDFLNIAQSTTHKPVQGESLLGQPSKNPSVAYSETGGLGGPNPSPEQHNVQSVRTNEWKLIYNKTTKKSELYNLVQDPGETNDLSEQNKDMKHQLQQELDTLNACHKDINNKFT